MNAPTALAKDRPLTPLKAWRKRQLVWDEDKKCRRTMRVTDAPRLYDIAWQTWNSWEQWPDDPAFRPPSAQNLERLFAITGGEVTPNDFCPIEEWKERLAAAGTATATDAGEHRGGG